MRNELLRLLKLTVTCKTVEEMQLKDSDFQHEDFRSFEKFDIINEKENFGFGMEILGTVSGWTIIALICTNFVFAGIIIFLLVKKDCGKKVDSPQRDEIEMPAIIQPQVTQPQEEAE